MSALTSLLVRDEVVSVRQIEDAIARQVLEGGELDTALLELDAANENALNAYRAASFSLPSVARDEVMQVSAATLSLVPGELARRFRIVPITHDAMTLTLAAVNPPSDTAMAELSGATGMRVECCIASEARIEAALAQFYGALLSPRMVRLLGRIEQVSAGTLPVVKPMKATPSGGLAAELFSEEAEDEEYGTDRVLRPSDVTVGKVVSVRPGPPSEPSLRGSRPARGSAATQPFGGSLAPPVEDPEPAPERAAKSDAAPKHGSPERAAKSDAAPKQPRPVASSTVREAPPRMAAPRRQRSAVVPQGPLSRELASRLLSEAADRDAVVEVFFRYARQYFDATALLSVRDDRLIGREIHNVPSLTDIRTLTITLARGSVLEDLARTLQPRVSDLSRREQDQPLANALLRSEAQPSALVPIVVQRRVVAVIYGDRGGEYFKLSELAPLSELLPEISRAFERIIRTRKVLDIHAGAVANNNAGASERAELGRAATQLDFDAVARENLRDVPAEPAAPELGVHDRDPTPSAADRREGLDAIANRREALEALDAHQAALDTLDVGREQPVVKPQLDATHSEALQKARRALTELGAPRTAPPPPGASARLANAQDPPAPRSRAPETELEPDRAPTAQLPAFVDEEIGLAESPRDEPSARGAGYFSKPPPGAGRYSSARESNGDETLVDAPKPDTARIRNARSLLPRADNAAEATGAEPLRPSQRPPKPPPGTGTYRSHDVFHEVVTLGPDVVADALTRPASVRAPGAPPVAESRGSQRPRAGDARTAAERARESRQPKPAEPRAAVRPPAPAPLDDRPPPSQALLAERKRDRSEPSSRPTPVEILRDPHRPRSLRPPSDGDGHAEPQRQRSARPIQSEAARDSRRPRSERPAPLSSPSELAGSQRPTPVETLREPKHPRSGPPSSEERRGSQRPRSQAPAGAAPDEAHRNSSRRPLAPDHRRETPTASPLPEFAPLPKTLSSRPAQPLPPAVVEPSARLKVLVEDLCACGPDDEGPTVSALVALGPDALTPLIERFPGPLWFDRRRPYSRLPFGRDTGPIARALAAFGDVALPRLAPLLRAKSADVRYYATLFASDQVHPELLAPIAERLFDDDPQIRRMVRDALPLYRHLPAFADTLRTIRARSLDVSSPLASRIAALDALSMLRDTGSVPALIELLAHADRQISVPAHRALVAITCQDFGVASRKWRAWYEEKQDMHRVQWLIESLMHAEQNVRSAAGIELQKITRVYYGFVATAPKRDRERAQKRYEQWWTHEGVKQFR